MFKKLSYFILSQLSSEQRDCIIGFKRFAFHKRVYPQKQLFIFCVDGTNFHGGLTDRFKGIISTFLFCLQNNIEFRIHYTFPFMLLDYLLPNEYNWQLREDEKISYNFFEAKYMFLVGDSSAKRFLRLKTKKQIHCYANRDIIEELNRIYGTKYTWGELFNMLFRPTDELRNRIESCKEQIGGEYVCASFRFQNLLGDFIDQNISVLNDRNKEILIKKCKQKLFWLQKEICNQQIFITSDSFLFLQQFVGYDNIFVFPEKIVHTDMEANQSYQAYLKSFLDFYLLSEGKMIYSIGTEEMYKSDFPKYAAKLNNIPFERILIE